jgi:hypothetical protein
METVIIYGASDDLIEVVGEVPGCDEYGSYSTDRAFIEFSTGDVFSIQYAKSGCWEVRHLVVKDGHSKLSYQFEPHADGDDPEPYTDTMTVTGRIKWVRFCRSWPMDFDDKASAVREWLRDDPSVEELSNDLVERLYDAITIEAD